MTVVGTDYVTMKDLIKLMDPNGDVARIAEVLDETNDMLKDAPMVEGNLPTGHQHTIRSGLPAGTWRLFNYGVKQTKGRTVQVTDACGMLDAVSDIDYDLSKLNGHKSVWRFSQDKPHIEGMNQDAANALVYGNQATDPEQITGFGPRFNDGTLGVNTVSENMINGGGTDSVNTSIWLIAWGPERVFLMYPKGMQGGIETIDRGKIDLLDGSGNPYLGYRKYFKWKLGLGIADWRYVVRFCNIDVADLLTDDGDVDAGANIIKGMIKMIHKLPKNATNRAFYVNETIETYLDLQTLQQKNMMVSYGPDQYGQEVLKFRRIPVRRMDAILDTEDPVSFS